MARTAVDWRSVRELLQEYAEGLGFDLSFQRFDEELANLERTYRAPRGQFLLARQAGVPVGCVGLRPFRAGFGEMKRLYVRPDARGVQTGRRLAVAVIAAARRAGYRRLVLDTMPTMDRAIALYQSLGFREIPAYRYNPDPGARYFALDLGTKRKPRTAGVASR